MQTSSSIKASQLANRFKEVLLDGTWVANTNYKEQLSTLGWELSEKKIKGLNTIAAIAQHIHYYIKGVNQVFKEQPLKINDASSFDFPPITSQDQWNDFLNTLWEDAKYFIKMIQNLSDTQLDQVFVKEVYGSYQRNIEGMIEHCYYHLGQIVLLKKMLLKH